MSDEQKDYDGIQYKADDRMPAIFKLLLAVLLIWGVCFMGYYLFSGWSSEAEFAEKKAAQEKLIAERQQAQQQKQADGSAGGPAAKITAVDAEKLYNDSCLACHGAQGSGGIGPALGAAQPFKYGRTEAELTSSIADGRPNGMPGYKNDLGPDKIKALVDYILSLK